MRVRKIKPGGQNTVRQLLIIAAAVALVLLVRLWLKQPRAARLRWALYTTVAAVVALVAFGKLHWLAAIGAAVASALPVVLKKLFLLFRYFPLLSGFISRAGYGKSGNARFESAWLRLEVNPALGTLDGEVLQGEFKGRRLSSMRMAELEQLRETLHGRDMKSEMLLKSYIVLRRRTRDAHSGNAGTRADGTMTSDEALSILGLKPGATHEHVITAHKRLMQKIHPDRGGSSYLAAKINQAKDVLLKQ